MVYAMIIIVDHRNVGATLAVAHDDRDGPAVYRAVHGDLRVVYYGCTISAAPC